LMDVQRDDSFDEVCLQRQQWHFDEDTRTWMLDRNEEWWMPAEAAQGLLSLLSS
jgi:hypothetical protein